MSENPFTVPFWESFVLHATLGVISAVVKNPNHKTALKTQLLAVRDAISEAYPGE